MSINIPTYGSLPLIHHGSTKSINISTKQKAGKL